MVRREVKRGDSSPKALSRAVMPGESDSSWRGAVDAIKRGAVEDDVDKLRVVAAAVNEDGCTIKADDADGGGLKPYAGVSDDGNATVTMVDSDKNLMVKVGFF